MDVNASRLEERLDPLEPPYKSRGEVEIGRLLDRYGIPFFYEQPIVIQDRGKYELWRPDFTLPTCQGMIVEYASVSDSPEERNTIRHRQDTYARNGIPALFVHPEDVGRPLWEKDLIHRITIAEQAYRIPVLFPVAVYRPPIE